VRALIGVGLAEYADPQYLRFDPAMLGSDLSPEERGSATAAWAEAVEAELEFLYRQRFQDANLAQNLALLELPNLLAALEYVARDEPAEPVVDFGDATRSVDLAVKPAHRTYSGD
jgi:hypothetical protein